MRSNGTKHWTAGELTRRSAPQAWRLPSNRRWDPCAPSPRRNLADNAPAARHLERVTGGTSLPRHLQGAIVALGNFDGFHCGHQAVVARAVEMARARGVAALVGTFEPHPVRYFRPGTAAFQLTTLDQRERLLAHAEVSALMVFRFDNQLASTTPEAFVGAELREVGGVVTGEDFAFGRAKSGSVEMLQALCGRRGLAYDAVAAVLADGEPVSSSRIRLAVRAGDCGQAARLLTRPFAIEGLLRPGKRRDSALPVLDASLQLGDYLRPRAGVYAVRGRLADGRTMGGSAYFAAAESPEHASPELEVFLVDLEERDLGRPIEIQLIAHLHDAQERYDLRGLRSQITNDVTEACELVSLLKH